MRVVDVLVILAGAGLIAGELWYFLGPRRQTRRRRRLKDRGAAGNE